MVKHFTKPIVPVQNIYLLGMKGAEGMTFSNNDNQDTVAGHIAMKDSDCEIRIGEWGNQFEWSAIFGNACPVEIEIGCGRGLFIINSAREYPDINYLGIEKSVSFFRILKDRVIKSKTENIRLIRMEAGYLLKKFITKQSVDAVHIYFPDPWPKKRHHKRRLINAGFLDAVACALAKDGCLFIATDFQDYFFEIIQAGTSCQDLQEIVRQEISPDGADPNTALTSYERKYLVQGRTIYKIIYRKQ